MKYDIIMFDGFDWDQGNISKIESRVPVAVIEDFFKGKILLKEDHRHSFNEERFIAMGHPITIKKCLFVAFTIRKRGNEIFIRPISARFTNKKEEKAYEEQIKKIQEK